MQRKMVLTLSLLLVCSWSLVSCETNDEDAPDSGQPDGGDTDSGGETDPLSSLFVSTTWLNENLQAADLVLVDARGTDFFDLGHIPGAQVVSFVEFSTPMTDPIVPGWANLIPPDELSTKLQTMGIDATKRVVVYADNSANDPARFGQDGRVVWALRMAGLTNSFMLDGGYPKWVADGLTTTTDATPAPAPSSFNVTSYDPTLTVTTEYLNTNSAAMKLIDSRTAEEYHGAILYGEARGGHLPGAISFHYVQVLNADNTTKTAAEITALLTPLGIATTDDIAVYCTSGIRSAHLTLVMQALGFSNAKNYDDSFKVWAQDPTLPLEEETFPDPD